MSFGWMKRRLTTARVLWVGNALGVAAMTGIGLEVSWTPRPVPAALLYALAAGATVLAGASFLLPGFLFRRAVLAIPFDQLSQEQVRGRLAMAYFTRILVAAALREAIAVLGLFVCIRGGPVSIAAVFFGLSGFLLPFAFPSVKEAIRLIDRHVPADLWR